MLEKVNMKITDWLISEGSIEAEDRDVYEYGIQTMMEKTLGLLSMFVIMLIMDNFLVGIIFIAAFKYLRRYAGGYHAETYLKCFLLSNMAFISVLTLIEYQMVNIMVYRILAFVSFVALYYLKPVESPNKTFSDKVKLIFCRNERITICIMALLCIIMVILRFTDIEKSIESAAILNGATSMWEVYRRRGNGSIHM